MIRNILHHTRQGIFAFLAFFLMASQVGAQTSQANEAIQVIDKMLVATDAIQTLSYTQKTYERINGKIQENKQKAVVQRKPFKVYLYNYYPNDGAEVLYVTGERDGKALVNPNKFPYVNLNLDPYGSLLRDNQHHTIFSSGFDDLANILRHLKKKFGADANKFIHYDGKITWNGRSCHVIKMENPGWGTVNYTVQAGEDLNKIARKHMVSEYMIMEMNSNIKSYDGVKAGQVIKIPSEYGKKAIFYIDTQMLLPIRTEVYDHLGLYERYEFFDVVVNPSLPADTFSSSNKNYKF